MAEAPSFALLGLDHVVVRARDIERLIAFYRDGLGCTVERRRPDLGLVHLRAGRSFIDLVDVAGPIGRKGGAAPGPEARNMDHLCLRAEPFDPAAIAAHVVRHGGRANEVADRFGADGEGPSIYVSDPEGNVVELKGPPRAPAIP